MRRDPSFEPLGGPDSDVELGDIEVFDYVAPDHQHPDQQGSDQQTSGQRHNQGQQELADRAALRRVAGLSTELTDVTEVEYRKLQLERVVLVGVWAGGTDRRSARPRWPNSPGSPRPPAPSSSTPLVQRRSQPDAATFIGSGKVAELRDIVESTGADTVICDGELSPGQLRNLEERLRVKVVDRTALILDIFAQHARSREGKAQVELAQLNYLVPRLRGWGAALSRQRGGRVAAGAGIGSRGPGETKLEIDRRRIHKRISQLRHDLARMRRVRDTKRDRRRAKAVPAVAIAGYTNAGKSSLLNRLTDAGVLVEDALFATLDPTTRRSRTADGRIFTLTDTVGFVRHLPHQLVESFRSTLEEIADADLLLHVVDASDEHPEEQVAAVREVLGEIDALAVPEILVVNKIDVADEMTLTRLRHLLADAVFVSARTGSRHRSAPRSESPNACPDPPVEIRRAGALHRGLARLAGARRGHRPAGGAHLRRHAATRARGLRARRPTRPLRGRGLTPARVSLAGRTVPPRQRPCGRCSSAVQSARRVGSARRSG